VLKSIQTWKKHIKNDNKIDCRISSKNGDFLKVGAEVAIFGSYSLIVASFGNFNTTFT